MAIFQWHMFDKYVISNAISGLLYFSPPIYRRGTIVFCGVRPCVRASVRVSGLMRDNRPSDFSQILQHVVFSYLVVYCKIFFLGKTLVAFQGPKRGKKTLKSPKRHIFRVSIHVTSCCKSCDIMWFSHTHTSKSCDIMWFSHMALPPNLIAAHTLFYYTSNGGTAPH